MEAKNLTFYYNIYINIAMQSKTIGGTYRQKKLEYSQNAVLLFSPPLRFY